MLNMVSTPMVTVPDSTPKAAPPENQRDSHHRKQVDGRIIERVSKDGVFERDHMLAVDDFKIGEGAIFAG